MDSRTGMAPGTINGPDYLQDTETGRVILPPGDNPDNLRYNIGVILKDPRYRRYQHKKVTTLLELDDLRDRLIQQERDELEQAREKIEPKTEDYRKSIIDRLYARSISSNTSEYEKEVIRGFLLLREKKHQEAFNKRFTCDTAYFSLREFDSAHAKSAVLDRVPSDESLFPKRK